MTNDLLVKVWDRLEPSLRKKLAKIIRFHHPDFDPARPTTFPELEELLSSMEANRELFITHGGLPGNLNRKTSRKRPKGFFGTWLSGLKKSKSAYKLARELELANLPKVYARIERRSFPSTGIWFSTNYCLKK